MPKFLRDIPPQDLWPWLLIGSGVVALAVLLLLISLLLRAGRRARRDDPLSRPEPPPRLSLAEQRAIERDIAALMDELSAMARQVGQQLDARAARIEQLLGAADDRIARLEQLEREPAPLPPSSSLSPSSPTLRPTTPFEAIRIDEPDPRHAEIYSLADEGLDLHQIAHRLRRPEGEVELILALRPRKTG
jgi:hypothetical protein